MKITRKNTTLKNLNHHLGLNDELNNLIEADFMDINVKISAFIDEEKEEVKFNQEFMWANFSAMISIPEPKLESKHLIALSEDRWVFNKNTGKYCTVVNFMLKDPEWTLKNALTYHPSKAIKFKDISCIIDFNLKSIILS